MKRSLLICALVPLFFTLLSSGQHVKTINIGGEGVELRHTAQNKFTISGIICSFARGDAEMLNGVPQEAGLKILIETGDGNYIQENFTYDQLVALEGQPIVIPRNTTFTYKTAPSYTAQATLVKTYDKGGPRTRKLAATDFAPRVDENAINQLNYPAGYQGLSLSVFDNRMVPGDAITGVITLVNPGLGRNMTFKVDKLLSASTWRKHTNFTVGRGTPTPDNLPYETIPVTVSGTNGLPVINIFFDLILSESALESKLPLHLSLDSINADLTIASSHDPNRLLLLRTCSSLTNNIFTFKVEMENTGIGKENDISVGLKFDRDKFRVQDIALIEARFQGGLISMQKITRSQDPVLCKRLDRSEVAIVFTDEQLQGVNTLPTGHPGTKGYAIFRVKLRPLVAGERARMQAMILFGSVDELTPTKIITIDHASLRALKRICSECSPKPSRTCKICKDADMQPTWICQF